MMFYDLKYALGLLIKFQKRFVTIFSMNFRAHFRVPINCCFGTVLSVSVVTFSADYCTFNML